MRTRMMNDARKTKGRRCPGSASVPRARLRPRTGRMPALPGGPRGQAVAEFAIVAAVLLVLPLVVIDLARAGLMQHDLDGAAADLARPLVRLTGADTSGSPR